MGSLLLSHRKMNQVPHLYASGSELSSVGRRRGGGNLLFWTVSAGIETVGVRIAMIQLREGGGESYHNASTL